MPNHLFDCTNIRFCLLSKGSILNRIIFSVVQISDIQRKIPPNIYIAISLCEDNAKLRSVQTVQFSIYATNNLTVKNVHRESICISYNSWYTLFSFPPLVPKPPLHNHSLPNDIITNQAAGVLLICHSYQIAFWKPHKIYEFAFKLTYSNYYNTRQKL